jgi:hypothetical protein
MARPRRTTSLRLDDYTVLFVCRSEPGLNGPVGEEAKGQVTSDQDSARGLISEDLGNRRLSRLRWSGDNDKSSHEAIIAVTSPIC